MSFSLLDLDAQQITKDISKITMINNLLKDVVILKPDNGNGIVLVDINDCRTSVKHLFSDKSKFRIVEMTQHLQDLIHCNSTYGN